MRKATVLSVLLLLVMLAGCASTTGTATNTSATNVAVTTYEGFGITLTQAKATEESMYAAGQLTAAQHNSFQQGVYTQARNCYLDIQAAADSYLKATDPTVQTTQQAKFNALMGQLPALVGAVTKFISDAKGGK
jgi:uncharacterized protein YcfL